MALAIGILLGGSIGQDMFANEQIELVSRLEEKYSASRAENSKWSQKANDLEKQTEQFDQLIRQMGDALVPGKLTGKSVVLLPLEQQNLRELSMFLQRAGAEVPTIVSLKDPELLLTNSILPTLAKMLAVPEDSADLQRLTQANVELQGTVRSRPDAVILLGHVGRTSFPRAQQFELSLIKELHKRNLRVIGAERSDAEFSAIPMYRMAKVPTVDNIDQSAGLLAIVGLIHGSDGHFGIKQTAETLLPSMGGISAGGAVEVKSQ
jgi:hypothetical protein